MTPLDAKIATLRSQGVTTRDIGAVVGYSHYGVSKRCQKQDVKALIEELSAKYITETIATTLDTQTQVIQAANKVATKLNSTPFPNLKLAEKAKTLLELSDKKEYRAMITAGILPSHGQSLVIQQFFSGPTNVVLGSDIAGMLSGATRPSGDDAIEAEWEDLGDVD